MLDLIGFLSVMTIYWGLALSVVLLILMIFTYKYLKDIGCERLAKRVTNLEGKIFGKDSGGDNVSSYWVVGLIFGAVAWIVAFVSVYYGDEYLWTSSVDMASCLAPYVWWLSLFIVYPIMVKVGKKVADVLRALDKIQNASE